MANKFIIREEWEVFKRRCVPQGWNDAQVETIRKAFYGGALVSFVKVVECAIKLNELEALEAFDEIQSEFNSFIEEQEVVQRGAPS